jgi:hypothetical protein
LLQAATALRAHTVEQAFGRCLELSLNLAQAAQASGIEVELVLWSVTGDRHFLDHWAVRVDGQQVIDPTRVQVDGRIALLHAAADYPPNYVRMRRYPAELLLPLYSARSVGRDGKLSQSFLWALRWRLFRYDVGRGPVLHSFHRLTHAVLSTLKFFLCDSARRMRDRLESRRDAIVTRRAIAGSAPSPTARCRTRSATASTASPRAAVARNAKT